MSFGLIYTNYAHFFSSTQNEARQNREIENWEILKSQKAHNFRTTQGKAVLNTYLESLWAQ